MNDHLQVYTEKKRNKSFTINCFNGIDCCPHVQLHLHTEYEIVYVKKGNGSIRVDNYETAYSDGALVFMGAYIPHYGLMNKEWDDNFEIVVHFDEYFIHNQLQLFPEFEKLIRLIRATNRVLVFDLKTKKELGPLFENMMLQKDLEQLVSLFKIFSEMTNADCYSTLLPEKYTISDGYSERLKQILDYINANFQNNISTRDIASHFSLTPNSFCRYFKKISPKPFVQFLNEFRINNVIYLLETTDYTVSEIMFLSGFTHFSYFIKQFKKIKNQSPGAYRKKLKARDD